jgi:exodeoxyribonuclease VII small subunit
MGSVKNLRRSESRAKGSPDMPEPTKEQTFESTMERLNALVHDMESDQLPLDRLLTAYEEGIQLVKICQGQLANAQQRLEIIQTNAARELEVKPFDPASTKAETPAVRASAKGASLF